MIDDSSWAEGESAGLIQRHQGFAPIPGQQGQDRLQISSIGRRRRESGEKRGDLRFTVQTKGFEQGEAVGQFVLATRQEASSLSARPDRDRQPRHNCRDAHGPGRDEKPTPRRRGRGGARHYKRCVRQHNHAPATPPRRRQGAAATVQAAPFSLEGKREQAARNRSNTAVTRSRHRRRGLFTLHSQDAWSEA